MGYPGSLQLTNCIRDLALFNLAIDGKLRACDLVKLKVRDVIICSCTINQSHHESKRYIHDSSRQTVRFQIISSLARFSAKANMGGIVGKHPPCHFGYVESWRSFQAEDNTDRDPFYPAQPTFSHFSRLPQ